MAIVFKDKLTILKFSNINARAKIVIGDTNEIIIESEKEDELNIQTIKTFWGQTLDIQRKLEEVDQQTVKKGKLSSFFNNISGSNVTISNNVTIINGNVINGSFSGSGVYIGSNEEIEMTIRVPKDQITTISLSNQTNITLEGISKSIKVDTSGQSTVHVLDINDVDVDSSGQSKIKIKNPNAVSLDTSGQTKIDIESKNLKNVDIDSSGQSNITIKGDIKYLKLSTSGMSNINVIGKVENKSISKSGLSNINIL